MRTPFVRIPSLDAFRGIAIALVLAWHLVLSLWHPAPGSVGAYISRFTGLFWMGVDVFFVLSGFLVTSVLLESKGKKGYFSNFYVRRAFRILPAYFLLLTACLTMRNADLVSAPAAHWLFDQCPPLWSCLTFLQNMTMTAQNEHGGQFLGPTWSLAVEEQFYLTLPVIVFYFSGRQLLRVMVLLFSVGFILKAVLFLQQAGSLSLWLPMPCRLDALMSGAFFAAWRRQYPIKAARLAKNQRLFAWLAVICFFSLTLALPRIGWGLLALGGASTLAVCIALALAAAAEAPSETNVAPLRYRWLMRLGTISYGVYLFHQPINGLLHGAILQHAPSIVNTPGILTTILALIVTLLLSTASWRFFESPLIRYGRLQNGTPRS